VKTRTFLEAYAIQAAWLKDVLAGLLDDGVRKDEIEVCRFPHEPLHVVVRVRGVQKYEHSIKLDP